MNRVGVPDIIKAKGVEKIPVLTAYSASIARLLDASGVPVILVGDSGGMVEGGAESTLPVTLDEMVYMTRSVRRVVKHSLVVADMPFGSYHVSIEEAKRSAIRLVKEGGADAVKLEGGVRMASTIKAIVGIDIPVMGHVGLTPQSLLRMGGYKVQGRGSGGDVVLSDGLAVEEAGAFSLVIEGVPAPLGKRITEALAIPTIGIGAGVNCDGQVLVTNDMLGLSPCGGEDGGPTTPPKFVKEYANLAATIGKAVERYMAEVRGGKFPSKKHSY